MKRKLMALLAGVLVLATCRAKDGIEVSNAWARTSLQGMNSAVYFEIENHNPEADELIGAASDVAEAVEIHESKMEGDVMTMSRVQSVVLAPSEKVEFKPGGYHIMLIDLGQDLKSGGQISITLQFRNGPDITLTVPVQEAGDMQNMESHSP